MREKIAKIDYEFGAQRIYWDWEKVSDKDRTWYLKKTDAILVLLVEELDKMISRHIKYGGNRISDAYNDALEDVRKDIKSYIGGEK